MGPAFLMIFSPHSFSLLLSARPYSTVHHDLYSPVIQPVHQSNTAAGFKTLRRDTKEWSGYDL